MYMDVYSGCIPLGTRLHAVHLNESDLLLPTDDDTHNSNEYECPDDLQGTLEEP
jgi:hypothetical protein